MRGWSATTVNRRSSGVRATLAVADDHDQRGDCAPRGPATAAPLSTSRPGESDGRSGEHCDQRDGGRRRSISHRQVRGIGCPPSERLIVGPRHVIPASGQHRRGDRRPPWVEQTDRRGTPLQCPADPIRNLTRASQFWFHHVPESSKKYWQDVFYKAHYRHRPARRGERGQRGCSAAKNSWVTATALSELPPSTTNVAQARSPR